MKPIRQTGLALAVVVAANLAAWPGRIEVRRDPAIDLRDRERIEAAHPELVLVGDSILRRGVDVEALSARTARPSLLVARGGAASAWWYLALKNQVVAADHRVPVALIVFRDHFLTEPGFRVTGKYAQALDAIAGAHEPVLDRLAYGRDAGLASLWERALPLYARRAELRAGVEGAVKDAWLGRALGLAPGEVDAALSRVFRTEALDAERLGALQAESEAPAADAAYDFEARLPQSFLPELVAVAEERGTRLIFVRAKRRRDLEPGTEPPQLGAYVHALETWLEARGIPLLDFSGDPRLVEAHYADGDHLAPAGRSVFTEMLAEALIPYL